MSGWKRKRHPDDVPTPVAVAVADFCRRAKAPASPGLVREALSMLDASHDPHVRQVTDLEPKAIPLGPFAVIDLIKGTPASEAAERQRSGYYELVRVAGEQQQDDEASASTPPPPPRVSSPSAPAPAKAKRTRKSRRLSVSEKIAPKKRTSGSEPARARPKQQLPGTAFLPKRNLPAPRGRFTRVDPSRSTFEALLKPESKDALSAIVDQSATRFHVLQALEPGYAGRSGNPLQVADVEGALTRHGLLATVLKKERESVLTAMATAKGSAPLAAKELGIRVQEVDVLVQELKLKNEVQEVRERFVREALEPSNLVARLSLLGRTRYLADLKIEKRFNDALTRDVTHLLDESAEAIADVDELIALTAKKHALPYDLLNRAMDRLGLLRRYTR